MGNGCGKEDEISSSIQSVRETHGSWWWVSTAVLQTRSRRYLCPTRLVQFRSKSSAKTPNRSWKLRSKPDKNGMPLLSSIGHHRCHNTQPLYLCTFSCAFKDFCCCPRCGQVLGRSMTGTNPYPYPYWGYRYHRRFYRRSSSKGSSRY